MATDGPSGQPDREETTALREERANATTLGDREELPPPIPQPSLPGRASSQTDDPPAPPPTQDRPRGEIGIRLLDTSRGVVVRGVIVGAAGDKAGIQPGDRILTVDGVPVNTMGEVRELVTPKFAGERCLIEVERDGQTERLAPLLEPHVGYYDKPGTRSRGGQAASTRPTYDDRAVAADPPRRSYPPSYRPRTPQPYGYYSVPRYPRSYGYYGGYYGRGYGLPYGGFYGPRYGRYYGTSRFGYRDFGYGRGGVRIGNFSIYW